MLEKNCFAAMVRGCWRSAVDHGIMAVPAFWSFPAAGDERRYVIWRRAAAVRRRLARRHRCWAALVSPARSRARRKGRSMSACPGRGQDRDRVRIRLCRGARRRLAATSPCGNMLFRLHSNPGWSVPDRSERRADRELVRAFWRQQRHGRGGGEKVPFPSPRWREGGAINVHAG